MRKKRVPRAGKRSARSKKVGRPSSVKRQARKKSSLNRMARVVPTARLDRGQRMLEVASHMVSYYMFLSHRLRSVAGEPDIGSGMFSATQSMNAQFSEIRRSLISVLSHHPVLMAKIERPAAETDRLAAAADGKAPTDPALKAIQQEAKKLSQGLREQSRAMSDLVAILRNV